MTRITFNKASASYTVTHSAAGAKRIVRDIPVKSQAVAVKIELRHGGPVSFGTEA